MYPYVGVTTIKLGFHVSQLIIAWLYYCDLSIKSIPFTIEKNWSDLDKECFCFILFIIHEKLVLSFVICL